MSQLTQDAIAELREYAEASHGIGEERLAEQLTLLLDWHEATEHGKGVVPLSTYESAVNGRREFRKLYRESASSLEALKEENERLKERRDWLRSELERSQAKNERLRKIEQGAHDLLCWTYSHTINVDPENYSRHVKDLHPGVYNSMNEAERQLYVALYPQEPNPALAKESGSDDIIKDQIANLKADPAFRDAWLTKTHPGHKQAVARMAELKSALSKERGS